MGRFLSEFMTMSISTVQAWTEPTALLRQVTVSASSSMAYGSTAVV